MRLYFRKCIQSSPILAIKWCAKIIYVPTLESIVLPFDLKSLSPVPANVTDEMSKHEWSGYSGCQLVMKFLQKHFRNFNVYVENKYCWTWDAGWCLAAQMSNIIKWSWIVSLIILVGLTMTCFSEEIMVSYSCIRGFMPDLHKKSWMVSKSGELSKQAFCKNIVKKDYFWSSNISFHQVQDSGRFSMTLLKQYEAH